MTTSTISQDPTIACPKCGAAIKLTESLAGPLVAATRAEMQSRIDGALLQAEEVQRAAENKSKVLEQTIADRVAEERRKADQAAKAKAEEAYGARFSELDNEVTGLRESLRAAQQAQAEAVRKERELEGRERAVTLTIEQGITEGVRAARDSALREAGEANRLALAEKDDQLAGLRKTIDDLRQKAAQGSQQTQGEVQEEDLKARLQGKFRMDNVQDVAKGVCGADLVQAVTDQRTGDVAGVILWESKRTKTFSTGWLPKLREDGRAAKADVLVLVTQALPEGVDAFDCVDGVWICTPRHAIPLAAVLREALLRALAERKAQAGLETRAEAVYKYVTGPRFRQRVEAVVEAFTTMRDDLEAEKRALQKVWAKRETQLERALLGAAGLLGDAQGAGAEVAEIEGLGLRALGGGE